MIPSKTDMFFAAFCLLIFSGSAESKPKKGTNCKMESGFCYDPVVEFVLTPDNPNPIVSIDINIGTAISIVLPKGVEIKPNGGPVIGNPKTLLPPKEIKKTDPIIIWLRPKTADPKIGAEQMEGDLNDVQIDLQTGYHLIINTRYTLKEGVKRVVYTDPQKVVLDNKKLKEKKSDLETREKQLQDALANLPITAREMAREIIAYGQLERRNCKFIRDRKLHDLIRVKTERICQLGNMVTIEFVIKNKSRSLFVLRRADVLVPGEDGLVPLESKFFWKGKKEPKLRYNDLVRGVAVFDVDESTESPEYTLEIEEAAGQKRKIVLSGIGF